MYGLRGLGAAGAGGARSGGVVLATGTASGGGAFGTSAGAQLREIQYPDGSTAVVDDRTGGLILLPPTASSGAGNVISPGLPPLPPSACSATQTYIPPGSVFPAGMAQAGQVTTTGACIDNAQPLPNTTFASTSPNWFTEQTLMGFGVPNWMVLAAGAGVAALFMMGGKHGR